MKRILTVMALAALAGACDRSGTTTSSGGGAAHSDDAGSTFVVRTSFYPVTYFTQRIGGGLVEVECLCPADEDAIFWQPSRPAIERFAEADLIVINGAEFEKWVAAVSLPESRVVATAEGLRDSWIEYQDTKTHSHGAVGVHTHRGVDGHTWLDPNNAKFQAGAIRDALVARLPGQKHEIESNAAALMRDLDGLDGRLRAITIGLGGVVLMASHPAYNYIAARYGWEIHNFDLDPGSMPGDEQLAAMNDLASGGGRLMLWESAPIAGAERLLAEQMGIASVVFSPCELMSDADLRETDYLREMRANLDRLEAAISSGAG